MSADAEGQKLYTGSDFDRNQTLFACLDIDDRLPANDPRRKPWLPPNKVQVFLSRAHPESDPAPPFAEPQPEGHVKAYLVSGCDEVAAVLSQPDVFGNVPYAELGGGGFMLALDPTVVNGNDPHRRQNAYAARQIAEYVKGDVMQRLAAESARQASVAGLQRDGFDLASLAEQAALRFCVMWFGFSSRDLPLLQEAAAAAYKGLTYQIVGRHFTHDPTVLPLSRQRMGQLAARTAALIGEYRRLKTFPREAVGTLRHRLDRRFWPVDVEPPDRWGLETLLPLLKRMAHDPDEFSVQELAVISVGMIAGTVGNVQASVCMVMRHLFGDVARLTSARKAARLEDSGAALKPLVAAAMAHNPPVAFLPRRTREDCRLGCEKIAKGSDIVLWLGAVPQRHQCPHRPGVPFGQLVAGNTNPHACIGAEPALTLVTAIVQAVLRLPTLAERINPLTGEAFGIKKRWGFACEHYPLMHRRAKRLAQQPLNVVMRVKAPIDLHGEAIRRVIRVGAPRIERALLESRHVHFAWFEFLEGGQKLVLHTVYDGDFDAYIEDFALNVDDLFDQLFEHIDGAPPLPVAENPGAFVDVIRANNAPPAEGYFFSAYPTLETPDILRHAGGSE